MAELQWRQVLDERPTYKPARRALARFLDLGPPFASCFRTFKVSDGAGLLLKISRMHGCSLRQVKAQAGAIVQSTGYLLGERPDIVFVDEPLSSAQMAGLYRATDAFVLPTRGEGWGRPFMEAMASGLPTIGTGASGNVDFMKSDNSLLIPAELIDVPEEAAAELPVYAGHRWYEPDSEKLSEAVQALFQDSELRERLSKRALETIRAGHDIAAGKRIWQTAITAAESRFARSELPQPTEAQIRLIWEGEFFAGHSFANINEQLTRLLFGDDEIAAAIERKIHNPASDRDCQELGLYASHMNRVFEDGAQVVVRHAFPPNWDPPQSGRWIHIQPWEFGHLPADWIEPLKRVDEIWAPSNYVRQVYEDSGIDSDKIHVIPWGVDPKVFSPEVPSRLLPSDKRFRFLFVGGTIHRKGYDRVLQAYLDEFSPQDDVCLVVKDLGTDTFYRYGNLQKETLDARDDPALPEILYFDERWTPGQLASLYTACHSLVMPYRGEGFGLPILEAMACGVPPIVPQGGASDDFVTSETGILLNSTTVETSHDWKLVGPALELEIDMAELRAQMRAAFENPDETGQRGVRAAAHVANNFTWGQAFELMRERIVFNAMHSHPVSSSNADTIFFNDKLVTACIRTSDNEMTIADCLARVVPYVDEVLVVDAGSTDRTVAIAKEYGARILTLASDQQLPEVEFERSVLTDWYFWLEPTTRLAEAEAAQICQLVKAQPQAASDVTMQTTHTRFDKAEEPIAKSLQFRRICSTGVGDSSMAAG